VQVLGGGIDDALLMVAGSSCHSHGQGGRVHGDAAVSSSLLRTTRKALEGSPLRPQGRKGPGTRRGITRPDERHGALERGPGAVLLVS
jgi:hypothetical protein